MEAHPAAGLIVGRKAMSLRSGAEFLGFTLRETVGPLLIFAGMLALLAYPALGAGAWSGSMAVVNVVAWVLLVSGVLRGIALKGAGQDPFFWLEVLAVVLSIIVGLLLLLSPGQGLRLLTAALVIFLIFESVAKFGLLPDRFPLGAGLMASILVGIVAAYFLYGGADLSFTSDTTLSLLLALLLIFEGVALTYLNWKNRISKTR